jgi:NAD(P)-dependent dehydrogenase (short-subunit alcohol dehydrogenase family)
MKAAVELGRRGGVIVTGGGSGLGEAVARRLRAEGMPVLIADLNPAAAKLATEIGAEFAVTDVSSEKSVQDAVHRAVGAFGTLSGAVNCAGIAIAQKVISKKGGE